MHHVFRPLDAEMAKAYRERFGSFHELIDPDPELTEPLKAWLHATDNIDQSLHDQIEALYASSLGASDLSTTYCATHYDLIDKNYVIREYETLESFAQIFSRYQQHEKRRIDYPQKLAVGFAVDATRECHLIKLSTINPLWTPKSESQFYKQAQQQLISQQKAFTDQVGQFLQTTSKHEWGSGWIGQLELDLPVLSTVLGGARNPVEVTTNRFRIRWVNWPNQQWQIQALSAEQLKSYFDSGKIAEADPDEKQHLRRSAQYSPDFAPSQTTSYKSSRSYNLVPDARRVLTDREVAMYKESQGEDQIPTERPKPSNPGEGHKFHRV